MRKAKKSQILEIIGSLKEVHSEIHKLLKHKDYHTAQSVLADCQQGAIEIGEAIEKSEGEECPAVKKIESYCEAVFQLYQQIEQLLDPDNCEAQGKIAELFVQEETIKKALEQVLEAIVAIKVRKEVAFFPYKASMWDSLESVYLAAKEDPDCDAYCVPIPYFDRKPDGSFAQMHYEGREYPKNIEVIDWKTYNFEERKPDTIYIHNPYDDGNYVTCVHPRFFSANLKKYTEELVYIPYFVLGEIDPGDQNTIDTMKHFVWTTGVIYADKVIVQSENMRQIYINEYLKAAKQCGLTGKHMDRSYLEKKFLGLGSPKFDKVLNTKKEDLEIPKEWLKLIQKPDGSWKKIIFYNTSVAALLNCNKKMLDKMRDVFRIFKENKDEVALLWRPHPLIRATIESMRPQLWHDYEQLVNQYQTEGWGIYDDSADMDRAVVLSDAYYGDESSVVQVYQKTGKPVMIQDVDTLSECGYSLVMSNTVVYDGKLWFVGMNDNGIYSLDTITYHAKLVQRIPWGNLREKKIQYGKILIYENKLLLIPWQASRIALYDLQTGELRYIEYSDKKCGTGAFFYDGILKDDKAFLIPSSYNKMICINMKNEKVEWVSEPLDDILHLSSGNCAFAFGGVTLEEKNILFTTIFDNLVVKYDIKSNFISEICVDDLDDGGTGVLGDSKGIWIIHKKKKEILYYSKDKNQSYVLNQFPQDFKGGEWNFHQGFVFEGDLILLPREANSCLRVSIDKQSVERIDIEEKDYSNNYWSKYLRYPSVFAIGSQFAIADYKGNINICSSNMKTRRKKIVIDCTGSDTNSVEPICYEEDNCFDNLCNFLKNVIVDYEQNSRAEGGC